MDYKIQEKYKLKKTVTKEVFASFLKSFVNFLFKAFYPESPDFIVKNQASKGFLGLIWSLLFIL